MSQAKQFAQLLEEFARVGVDPNTISAGLAVSEEDARRALAMLPDGAGPAAFLRQGAGAAYKHSSPDADV